MIVSYSGNAHGLQIKKIFLTIEKNWPRVAFHSNFSPFKMEKGEVNLDNKAPKAASHHFSAATTNAQSKFDSPLRYQIEGCNVTAPIRILYHYTPNVWLCHHVLELVYECILMS